MHAIHVLTATRRWRLKNSGAPALLPAGPLKSMHPHVHWGEIPLRYSQVKVSEVSEMVSFTFTAVSQLCYSPQPYRQNQTGSPSEKSAPVENSGNVPRSYTDDAAGAPLRAMCLYRPIPLKSAVVRNARWSS